MPEAYQKWYARPVYTGTIDLDGIAERIQRNSTAKKSDAKAVLTEMVEVITDALQASQRVHIDGFGTFKIGISSKGVSSVKDFSITENLKGVRVLFQPETTRVVVGQEKKSDGSVKQKYVNAITLLKDVVFEETHDNAMNVEPEP
jgi:predicted histone-like DNA-binding protein